MNDSTNPIIKNDAVYDTLKYFAQIVLPGVATLYFALSQIWGFPYGAEIVGTIAALDAFLGVLLGISNKQYMQSDIRFDGTVDVIETADKKTFSLNFDGDPYALDQKDELLFRVKKEAA